MPFIVGQSLMHTISKTIAATPIRQRVSPIILPIKKAAIINDNTPRIKIVT